MSRKTNSPKILMALILACLLCALPVAAEKAFAGDRHRPGPAFPRRGRIYRQLPHGHRTVVHGRSKYFHHRGVFYRRGFSGYIVIGAPVGALIVDLPIGFKTVLVGGSTYYWCAGVYYRKVPSGYVVVESPLPTEPSIAEGVQVSVTVDLLNVRSGPAMSRDVLARVPRGTVLVVRGNAPGWLYVELPDSRFGWVVSEYTAASTLMPRG